MNYAHPCNPGTLGSRWHDPKRKALHVGDDYKVGTGTTIRAIEAGRVVAVAQHRLWGFYVQIEHADRRVSSYHQLQRGGRPAVGATVRKGDSVGRVGQPLNNSTEARREADPTWAGQVKRDSAGTLVSTGPHFHLGILSRIGGPWVNPATVITTTAVASGAASTPLEEAMSAQDVWDYKIGEAGVPGRNDEKAWVRLGKIADEIVNPIDKRDGKRGPDGKPGRDTMRGLVASAHAEATWAKDEAKRATTAAIEARDAVRALKPSTVAVDAETLARALKDPAVTAVIGQSVVDALAVRMAA